MEYAKSETLNQWFHADDVTKEQVEQEIMVCPACFERVFLKHSTITGRQWFCHYKAKPNAMCELRVRSIVQAALSPPKPSFPQGQELERLLKRFEDILLENEEDEAAWRKLIDKIRSRKAFRGFMNLVREILRKTCRETANQTRAENEHLSEVVYHICAPNSFRLLAFSVCYGSLYFLQVGEPNLREEGREVGHSEEYINDVLNSFSFYKVVFAPSEKQFVEQLMAIDSDRNKRAEKVLRAMHLAVAATASTFAALMEQRSGGIVADWKIGVGNITAKLR